MEKRNIFLLITAVLVLTVDTGLGAVLTLQPQSLTLSSNVTTGSLTLTCGPSPGAGTNLQLLSINLNTSTSTTSTLLASADGEKNNGNAVMVTTNFPGTVSGGLSTRSMTLTLTQASCDYEGAYSCRALIITSGVTYDTTDPKQFTVQVTPGDIQLTADPSNEEYTEYQQLTITCNGLIGYVRANATPPEWRWEYQNQGDINFNPVTDDGNNIVTETPFNEPNNKCAKRQITRLILNLTESDSGRMYRCYVFKDGMSYTSAAGVFTVQQVVSAGGNQKPETAGNVAPASANIGAIVGGVIGGIVVIAIVVVLVYFLWYRKRDAGEKYSTREPDHSHPADERAPHPSEHPTFAKPNRARDRENGENDRNRLRTKNQDGLHYAELDIIRKSPMDSSSDSISSRSQPPTEYASIRLF